MAIDWKDTSASRSASNGSNPWFAISIGLIGLIIGYVLPSYLS